MKQNKIIKMIISSCFFFMLTELNELNEIANCVDPDEAVHNESSHLDLHCLSFSLMIYIELLTFQYLKMFYSSYACIPPKGLQFWVLREY